MFHEDKVGSSAWNSELPGAFPWDEPVTLVYIKLNAHCQTHYTDYYKELRVNENNTLYCFVKDSLKWTWLFPLWMCGNKNTMTASCLVYFAVPALNCDGSFAHCCFCTISLNVNAARKAWYLSISMKNVLPYGPPDTVSGIPALLYGKGKGLHVLGNFSRVCMEL